MPSKRVHAWHHIRGFTRKSMVLKRRPNSGQTPGTMAEDKKKNMAMSAGGTF